MMRIAVLIYGQYRELDIAVKSWVFKDLFYTDFYFSLWDKTTMKSNNTEEKFEIMVNEEMIKKIIPNATVSILKENEYFETISNDMIYVNKSQRAICHMKNCLKLVENSRINYDNIMLTRTDQFMTSYDNYESFSNLSKENEIYGLSEIYNVHEEKFMIDTFLFGQYYTIKKFIEKLPNHDKVGLHKDMAQTIIDTGINLKKIEKFVCTLVRPNCRELNDFELNHETISKKMLEWGANY